MRSARHAHNRATARGTALHRSEETCAQQAPVSGLKTDRFSILRDSHNHTTSLCIYDSACLKHTNFLDRQAAVHMKPFNTSVFEKSSPRPIFVCCDIVVVLSKCGANYNSMPNSFATAQMKSPSHAPLPRAYPSASADDKASDLCVPSQVMIVQPPSCATPVDVDLRPTLSVAQSLSTIICNESTSFQDSSFGVQSRVPVRSLQMRFAFCRWISHSSGTLLDTELNVWAFSGEEHQFAHNLTILTLFSWTKQRFLIRNRSIQIAHQENAQDCIAANKHWTTDCRRVLQVA